jgi:pyruvate/2-oxoacid:ferredoxin oxidoreductase beta subunit
MKMAEMLAALDGVVYAERVALYDAKQVLRARRAIFHAFEVQLQGQGLGLVEVLSACVTNLKVKPVDAQKWVAEEMCKTFPLGVFKDTRATVEVPPPVLTG